MFRRLKFLICAALLFALTDGHWAVLQSIAWAGMIHQYSATTPITEAIRDTFSGAKPCSLCEQIASARSNRPKQNPSAPDSTVRVKLDPFSIHTKTRQPLPKVRLVSYPPSSLLKPASRAEAPPTPVPRIFLS